MLKIDWYLEHPLEFEYKSYILLDYIQSVDKSFQILKLSPYLLWTEKLLFELKDFDTKSKLFHKGFDKNVLLFKDDKIRLIKKTLEQSEYLIIINDIINYSCPLLESKVKLGYKLLNKYPQIIF